MLFVYLEEVKRGPVYRHSHNNKIRPDTGNGEVVYVTEASLRAVHHVVPGAGREQPQPKRTFRRSVSPLAPHASKPALGCGAADGHTPAAFPTSGYPPRARQRARANWPAPLHRVWPARTPPPCPVAPPNACACHSSRRRTASKPAAACASASGERLPPAHIHHTTHPALGLAAAHGVARDHA